MISATTEKRKHAEMVNPLSVLLDLRLMALASCGIVFMMSFWNLADVVIGGAHEKVALDWQLLLKLGLSALLSLYGAIGFFTDVRIRKVLFSTPGIWLFLIGVMYLLTALLSVQKMQSLVSSGLLMGAILGMTTLCVWEGRTVALKTIFYGCVVFCFGSWVMYLAIPEIGVFQEPIPGGKFLERMGGLSHPNTLGQYSAITVLMSITLLRLGEIKKPFAVMVIMMALGSLVFSISRTSTAACFAGILFVYRDILFRRSNFEFLLVGAIVCVTVGGFGLAFLNWDQKIENRLESLLKKSSESEVDELSTATGRSVIWAKSIELIREKPITGWGAGTSKELLRDYTFYTHNALLNVLLSTGIFGGLLLLGLLGNMIFKAFANPSVFADAMIIFIMLNGVMENVIFSNVPAAPTLVLVIVVLWRLLPKVAPETNWTDQADQIQAGPRDDGHAKSLSIESGGTA